MVVGIITQQIGMSNNGHQSSRKASRWNPFSTNSSRRKSVIFDVSTLFSAIVSLFTDLLSMFSLDWESDFLLFVLDPRFLDSLFQNTCLFTISSALGRPLFLQCSLFSCRKLLSDFFRSWSSFRASSEQSSRALDLAVLFLLSCCMEQSEDSSSSSSWEHCSVIFLNKRSSFSLIVISMLFMQSSRSYCSFIYFCPLFIYFFCYGSTGYFGMADFIYCLLLSYKIQASFYNIFYLSKLFSSSFTDSSLLSSSSLCSQKASQIAGSSTTILTKSLGS